MRSINTETFHGVALVLALALGGCALSREAEPSASAAPAGATPAEPKAGQAPTLPQTTRKVIRNARLTLEVASPEAAQGKVSALIERLGGYVASAEQEVVAPEAGEPQTNVRLSLRVPSERLAEALRELKRLGTGARSEQVGSEDVTDEYIDVSARVSNQRRLEEQLVTLLRQAKNVEEAMKVHHELTNVRTEIDRWEGRKRVLEHETALAKVDLALVTVRPVSALSFAELGVSVRRAAGDSLSMASALVTFAVRGAGVTLPIALLLGAPGLGLWWLVRRQRRKSVLASS